MTKKILRYISIVLGVFALLIIYLSTVGIETEKFNNQIQDLVKQKNDKFDASLKKIKLTIDPLNFKINIKTINAKIIFIIITFRCPFIGFFTANFRSKICTFEARPFFSFYY